MIYDLRSAFLFQHIQQRRKKRKLIGSIVRGRPFRSVPHPRNPTMSKSEEWEEETLCPICMEHPHNAILLICSSHEKGCRPFMCGAAYDPHSNCFDQFRKSLPPRRPLPEGPRSRLRRRRQLACPLCRGSIRGWRVFESARYLMNARPRSCPREDCGFSGTYRDLCEHAGSAHPSVGPAKAIDPRRPEDTEDRVVGTVERLVSLRTPENMRAIKDRIGTLEPCELEEVRLRVHLYVASGRGRAVGPLWSGGSGDGGRRVRRRLDD